MSGLELAAEIDVPVLFMSGQLDYPPLRPWHLPQGSPLIAKHFISSALPTKGRGALDDASRG